MIKEIAKKLCEKSPCHHKCHDTKDCVVEDEAREHFPFALTNEEKVSENGKLLLITENKSNNFDVKSNNELFKQALVEGLNRCFDRDLQIAEMTETINELYGADAMYYGVDSYGIATALYNAGCRKQSEWISVEDRLPEKYKSVLIFCEDEIRIDFIGSYGCWYENFYYQVTHWMPLPEAPKTKGGE